MLVIIEKMALLTIMLAIGYLCAKLKLVGQDFNKGLSKLVINVFLAGMILSSVINKQLDMSGGDLAFGIGMLTVMSLISLGLGFLTTTIPSLKNGDAGMYRILIGFGNAGFVGLPVVSAVYGEGAVFFAALINIPFNILLYTVGVMQLQRGAGVKKFELKKVLNVPIIATLLATVIFVFEIPMPLIVEDTASTIGAACVPLSMMSVGLSLGSVSIKDALTQPRLYVINFVKLLVVPVVTWALLRPLIDDAVMFGTIVLLAACPPAIVCPILGIDYGRDGVESSEAVFIGSVLSVVTVPILISVLGL